MENLVFELDYVTRIWAACSAGHKLPGVVPNYSKVELINQGNCPVFVMKNLPKCSAVLQRFCLIRTMFNLACHCGEGNDPEGDRYYALVG